MRQQMSKTRKIYFARLWGRFIILCLSIALYFYKKSAFAVMEGMQFFHSFSPLHILWVIWVWDMLLQLIPVKAHISIGSRKLFQSVYRPMQQKLQDGGLRKHIIDTTKSAYKVLAIWILLHIGIAALYFHGPIGAAEIFLISVFFYVCDLICVLIWCPFRLIMKNKCCTTCRIFNWDHLMMFSPFVLIPGVFTWSLLGMAFLIWLVWELCVFLYPERFWENSNMALRCSECTDKLCTQYCRKLRDENQVPKEEAI